MVSADPESNFRGSSRSMAAMMDVREAFRLDFEAMSTPNKEIPADPAGEVFGV
jgi:hypothetical protein